MKNIKERVALMFLISGPIFLVLAAGWWLLTTGEVPIFAKLGIIGGISLLIGLISYGASEVE